MELFDFESDERAVKAREQYQSLPVQPAAEHEIPARQPEDGQSLLQTVIMIVGAIILIILLVLFARWLYHKIHHTTVTTPITQGQLPQQAPGPAGSQAPANSQPSGAANSSSSASSPATANKSLPNNGPGDVAGIFIGSTLAAAGLHYIISLRRFNKTGV